eukprot:1014188-Prymnesium_polylepis.1
MAHVRGNGCVVCGRRPPQHNDSWSHRRRICATKQRDGAPPSIVCRTWVVCNAPAVGAATYDTGAVIGDSERAIVER